jgi:hypothetical protein
MPRSWAGFTNWANMPWTELPERKIVHAIPFHHPQSIISLHPFTITNTNCTPAITNLRGRPCVALAGGGAAGDGSNFCCGVAGILLKAGVETIVRGAFSMATLAQHTIEFGLSVVGTGLITTPASDFVKVKSAGATLTVQCQKATGGIQSFAVPLAPAAATWYDFAMRIAPDPVTAGAGVINLAIGTNWIPGQGAPQSWTFPVGVGYMPDTVNLAEYCAFQASAGTTASHFEYYVLETGAIPAW